MPEFDFYVGGIEDGIIQVLTDAYLKGPENPNSYLKQIGSYGGELDEQTLRKYVQQLAPKMPLTLVAYGDGDDKMSPATAAVFDEPRIFEHRCTFTVICCSADARGETARRRGATGGGGVGVYRMIADVRKALAGLRLWRPLDLDLEYGVGWYGAGPDKELLTLDPLTLSGVEYLARLPELTAYAQHFDTRFKWEETDRRAATTPVSEAVIFEVEPTNDPGAPGGWPGVRIA